MREYGRWIKNIAAFFLLMALLSLLLPFCWFQAAGTRVELSGMEVLTTAARAGITYVRHGEVDDDFVVKDPFTWGEVKDGFSYAREAVGNKTLLTAAAAIALPVVLCILAMILLAVAEGKKTMVTPTLLVTVSVAEILLAFLIAGKFRSYLLTGAAMFAVFLGIAFILIWFGWFTGGYRRRRRTLRQGGSEDDSSDDKGNRHRRKHARKRRKKRTKTKNKTTRTKEQETENTAEKKQASPEPEGLTGMVQESRQGDQSLLEQEGCKITFEPDKAQYKIYNQSSKEICVQPVTGEGEWLLKPGQKARVADSVLVGMKEQGCFVKLK